MGSDPGSGELPCWVVAVRRWFLRADAGVEERKPVTCLSIRHVDGDRQFAEPPAIDTRFAWNGAWSRQHLTAAVDVGREVAGDLIGGGHALIVTRRPFDTFTDTDSGAEPRLDGTTFDTTTMRRTAKPTQSG